MTQAWKMSLLQCAIVIGDYLRRYSMGFVIGVLVVVALVLVIVYLSDRT